MKVTQRLHLVRQLLGISILVTLLAACAGAEKEKPMDKAAAASDSSYSSSQSQSSITSATTKAKHKDSPSDKELIKQQLPDYPLDTCVVSGEKLGGMGDSVNYLYQGRLVRFCCPACEKEFLTSPDRYLAKLDAAKAKK